MSTDAENPTVFWAEVLPFDENGGVRHLREKIFKKKVKQKKRFDFVQSTKETFQKGFGEVLFSLTYLSRAQRLTMNVFKTRNLHGQNLDQNAGNLFYIHGGHVCTYDPFHFRK